MTAGKVNIEWYGEEFIRKSVAAADNALAATATFVVREIRAEMRNSTGRIVGKKGNRNVYQASLPGTPPGRRSGRLANSITSVRKGALLYGVGTNLEYARIHEFGGTINHPGGTHYVLFGGVPTFIKERQANQLSRKGFFVGKTRPHAIPMPKRPYLLPTLNRLQSEGAIQERFNRRFKSEMKRETA